MTQPSLAILVEDSTHLVKSLQNALAAACEIRDQADAAHANGLRPEDAARIRRWGEMLNLAMSSATRMADEIDIEYRLAVGETPKPASYAEAAGLGCFMYATAAVYAKGVQEASQIAGQYGLAGAEAEAQYRELTEDYVAARRRAAGLEVRDSA